MSKELIEQLAKGKTEHFKYLCSLLPSEVMWGDSITPQIVGEIIEAYQAAAPIDNVREALEERDRLGYTVVEVIGKIDEINEQVEEITLHDVNYFAVPAELWNELQDALEEMPNRAERALIPSTQAPNTSGVRDETK
jgi:hypothetical protein